MDGLRGRLSALDELLSALLGLGVAETDAVASEGVLTAELGGADSSLWSSTPFLSTSAALAGRRGLAFPESRRRKVLPVTARR